MSSSSTLASCSPRVTIEINDALRDVLRATSESSAADESLRRRASVAARETTVDYRVVFDACAHARRTMRKSEWGKTIVRVNARAKSLRFDVDRDAETRELTEEEQTARREHRERMRALRDAVEEQRYEMMTRDVARSRRANANSMSSFAMGVKEETRAYAFAAHVATVMFAFAAAGYVGGGAVERAANGAAWARGLCAALGAALGLFTEAGLMILRETRV